MSMFPFHNYIMVDTSQHNSGGTEGKTERSDTDSGRTRTNSVATGILRNC